MIEAKTRIDPRGRSLADPATPSPEPQPPETPSLESPGTPQVSGEVLDLPRLRLLAAPEALPRAVVIHRDRFESLDLAERAIARAMEEGAALRRTAVEDAQRLREEGWREGWQEGRQSLAALEVALRADAVRLRAEAGDRLLRLAVTLAERILGQELRSHPEAILSLVRQALAQVSFCSRAVLRLHPEDARALAGAYPALATAAQGGAELEVREDPALARGDCLVETDGGRVDGSVNVLLASLEEALRAGASAPGPTPAPERHP